MMLPGLYNVAALILLGTVSKGEMPEDDFRIVNRQGKVFFTYHKYLGTYCV